MEHLFNHPPRSPHATGGLGHTDGLGVAEIAAGQINLETIAERVGKWLYVSIPTGKRRGADWGIVKLVICIAARGRNVSDILKIVGSLNFRTLDRIIRNTRLGLRVPFERDTIAIRPRGKCVDARSIIEAEDGNDG